MIKICLTGDSISSNPYSGILSPVNIVDFISFQIPQVTQRNITYPSDNIALQTIRWNQLTDEEKLSFDFIISMNGNNDTLATMQSSYQAFFDMLRSEIKTSCKIIALTMTPYGGAEKLEERTARNNFILGNGTPALTGIDAYVTGHTSYLDDGTNTLKTEYWASPTDRLHINPAAMEVIADFIVAKMKEMGWV